MRNLYKVYLMPQAESGTMNQIVLANPRPGANGSFQYADFSVINCIKRKMLSLELCACLCCRNN